MWHMVNKAICHGNAQCSVCGRAWLVPYRELTCKRPPGGSLSEDDKDGWAGLIVPDVDVPPGWMVSQKPGRPLVAGETGETGPCGNERDW